MREHALLVLIFYFLVVADVERLFVSPMTIHISFLRNISLGLLPLFQRSVCSVAMGLPKFLIVLEISLLSEVFAFCGLSSLHGPLPVCRGFLMSACLSALPLFPVLWGSYLKK